MSDNRDQESVESGMDAGTGDPGTDRAFLQDQPPAQVDAEKVAEHSEEDDSEAGDVAAAAQD